MIPREMIEKFIQDYDLNLTGPEVIKNITMSFLGHHKFEIGYDIDQEGKNKFSEESKPKNHEIAEILKTCKRTNKLDLWENHSV